MILRVNKAMKRFLECCATDPTLYGSMHELVNAMRVANEQSGSPVSEHVLAALEAVDRKAYGGEYCQIPARIACGQSMTAPYLHACYAALLESAIPRECSILEVGTGTGVQAAIYHTLFPHAKITTIERHALLAEQAREHFARDGLAIKTIVMQPNTLQALLSSKEAFDAITFGCSIDKPALEPYFGLLKKNGILISPVLKREGDNTAMLSVFANRCQEYEITRVSFVPYKAV